MIAEARNRQLTAQGVSPFFSAGGPPLPPPEVAAPRLPKAPSPFAGLEMEVKFRAWALSEPVECLCAVRLDELALINWRLIIESIVCR